ncbi:MAG: class II glutamine amidotransferase [Chromatiales bacterium]|jgi:predicted glutamine amidotransferase|nr:class II glutamine amidotransferase [Chromatiales bacterium]
MCRWLAYSGPEVYLDSLLYEPKNSLASQSLSAQESKWPTNGDGFGVGWYGSRATPGLFRDVLPAWNDSNLRNVSAQISSQLFFAHVRASTGTSISRVNCHPFRYENRLFMHNGQIGGFDSIRRRLLLTVEPALFSHMEGSTDSELFFYLLLGNNPDDNPKSAFAKTVQDVLNVMAEFDVQEPFRMSAAFSDGEDIHAVRFASDDEPPSLYHGSLGPDAPAALSDRSGTLVVSEPLDESEDMWSAVPPGHYLHVHGTDTTVSALF